MVYEPFKDPESRDPFSPSRGGVPYMGEDDGPQDGDMSGPAVPEDNSDQPHVMLEQYVQNMARAEQALQTEHTTVCEQLEKLTRRKLRIEGQIEMLQVSGRYTNEQIQMFYESGKRIDGAKLRY